jgi:phage-related protein
MDIFLRAEVPRPLRWVGSARKDLLALPGEVVDVFGFALHLAQIGEKHDQAKPLRGFGGAGVLEVVADHLGDTYRAVYTIRSAGAVYVLHCFKKKSTRGDVTPRRDIERIQDRLKVALAHEEDQ